ncbi:ankyrin repeat protein [Trichuris suis]|nr:ankyrin repeat protein [Trichuris suis]
MVARRGFGWHSATSSSPVEPTLSRTRTGSNRDCRYAGRRSKRVPFCIASTNTNFRWRKRLMTSKTMEHADLIAELPLIEKLTAVERIQLAKQRRALQLMRWQEREQKEESCTDGLSPVVPLRRKKARVRFSSGTVLLEATSRHDVDEVRQLLNLGADPNAHNEDGLTALHQCAIDDEDVIMQVLIDHGANVNSRDSEMWTPLHAAACCGHIRAMKILIENGAELLAVNSDGNMPYDICDEEAALDYVETEMANRGKNSTFALIGHTH